MLKTPLFGLVLVTLALLTVRCSTDDGAPAVANTPPPPPATIGKDEPVVIKSTFTMLVSSAKDRPLMLMANPTTLPVTVVNAPNANMQVETKDFTIPQISNAVLNFGQLSILSLTDNNLQVCGSDGKTKCTKAFIRIYTTGTAGPGLYNTADGYGMPISATLAGIPPMTVGLGTPNAAVIQNATIAANKHVLRLNDFGASAVYQIKSDFT